MREDIIICASLQAFELVLSRALKNDRSNWRLQFPGAAAGPQPFLQTVEDLLWLLLRTPRPEQDFQASLVPICGHRYVVCTRNLNTSVVLSVVVYDVDAIVYAISL